MIELISIHIAKTGGRSFYEILKNEYGDKLDPRTRRIEYFPGRDFSKNLLESIPPHVTVIHGHLFYEHVREIHRRYDARIVTWLRDPVERVISNYFFLMRAIREAPETHPQRRKAAYTLMEYAHDSIPDKMSKYLRGIHLQELFFIGFQENYEQDLEQLTELLSWKKPLIKPRINTGPEGTEEEDYPTRRKDITGEMREQIREMNAGDVQLYELAKSIRKERYRD
ncbi:MAG: sulfotransferase family 2 domain-containing protein [Bacteroidetes bacterium]|nr:sulfotransferase family 2 domain-containing protein [Bacteroidota bacterium]